MAFTGSSTSKSITSAPWARAMARRSSTVSTANTRPAPCSLALAMASCPTGPQPKMATVLPGLISASSAPNQAVGKMSDSRMAWSSGTSSGNFTRPTLANGMRAFSACRPG